MQPDHEIRSSIEYDMRNIFLEKLYTQNVVEELTLDQQSQMLQGLF